MPKYLIERNLPGVHEMSAEQLHLAANESCDTLERLGTDIRWERSFVTPDRLTCVYIARDEQIVREHARISGFPADTIHEIATEIGPETAEPRRPGAIRAEAS